MSAVRKELELTFSPIEVAAAFRNRDHFAFLDSSRNDPEQGRHSILAWNPVQVFRTKGEDPFPSLDKLLQSGIGAGAIGYFSYDLFRYLEDYPLLNAIDDLMLPDCCLAVYETVMFFDHARNRWEIAAASPDLIEKRVGEIQSLVRNHRIERAARVQAGPQESNMTKAQYVSAVRKALRYIGAGDIYQVNLSQRFSQTFQGSSFDLFMNLREVSPSFYGAYLNCGDHAVISSSPELFLKRENDEIETRPIKGTRPRGRTKAEDEVFESDLIGSEKEAAELTMIVDLERNDLGRICEFNSVEVAAHRYIDRLPAVFHTVSTVRGRLRTGTSVVDILRATFPGGSISGCPKIRAIEIIDELEPVRRHVYTGAIGYIGPDGELKLNIGIRTMTVVNNRVYYQAGSGIVADSDPEKEYEETLQKAVGMRRALEI